MAFPSLAGNDCLCPYYSHLLPLGLWASPGLLKNSPGMSHDVLVSLLFRWSGLHSFERESFP